MRNIDNPNKHNQEFREKSKEEKIATEINKPKEKKFDELSREPDVYQRVRMWLDVICENFENPKERLSELMKTFDPFFNHIDRDILSDEKIEEIRNNLQACELVKDKKEFLELVIKTLKPALDIRYINASKFEEAQAKAMNESKGFIEINRLLSYEKYGSVIRIHAPAGKTVDNKITLYRDGMRKLAEIINNDPEIQEVFAASPLIASHPGLFIRLGFKIGDVSDEFKHQYFSATEDVKMATITREEFLKNNLKE